MALEQGLQSIVRAYERGELTQISLLLKIGSECYLSNNENEDDYKQLAIVCYPKDNTLDDMTHHLFVIFKWHRMYHKVSWGEIWNCKVNVSSIKRGYAGGADVVIWAVHPVAEMEV